ncbi:hypothetical protein ANO11243_096080 [Dothideomycetidae sp. 11243]|nr:hypothetical protein ANO11243_096080 [fungal sp. No.11243]
MAQQDPAIRKVPDFWFSLPPEDWFSDKQDKYIIDNFSSYVDKARLTDELDGTWTSTPSGSLALVLLLDQFTRNIYRPGNHPEPGLSWSCDKKALKVATNAIAKGWDRKVQQEHSSQRGRGYIHRRFLYLPFMHAEDMQSQTACCALCENLALELEVEYLQKQARGEEETKEDEAFRKRMRGDVAFAERHRDCVAMHGRFPKRNEPLGRESTEAEKKFLEENPDGF